MGLIKAALGSAGGVLADQWREYFYCDSMNADTLAVKGQKRTSSTRSSNTKGTDNVITNGAVIAVNEGQAMMIVDQGKVVEFTAEAGEFTWDSSSQPSIFYGGLGEGLKKSFEQFGRRFGFGGDAGSDQRVYFFNLKEIIGNKYGTATPIPFRIVDTNIGLDVDAAVRCNGEYSYKMVDPMAFYVNICGNVEAPYTKDKLDSQMKSELLTALQPAFAKISGEGVRYSAVPGHTEEICAELDRQLSQKWTVLRGLKIVSFGCNSISLTEEYEKKLTDRQFNAALRDPNMRAAQLAGQASDAFGTAAANENGAMMGFMGMGMVGGAANMMNQSYGGNQGSYQMPANNYAVAANGGFGGQQPQQMPQQDPQMQQQMQPQPQVEGWTCSCGQAGNTGKFCAECGSPKPEPVAPDGWTCSCGAFNQGKFCAECGSKKPAGVPQYRCDKCGWAPEDPTNPPKFCPECGDPFGDEDII